MTVSFPVRSLPPLVIGEVLFDRFDDGRSVLGGAPFNVAWNLLGLGLQPTFVSAVGDDADGKRIRDRMAAWNMDLRGLQTAAGNATGTVQVTLAREQPSYEIVYPCAYDCIGLPPFADSLDQFSMLYHGSLAWRGERSRATLAHLLTDLSLPRFVDINIREPWFDRAWLPTLLSGAEYVKLNDEELGALTGLPCSTADEIFVAAARLRDEFGAAIYFVTCGSQGAYAVSGAAITFAAAPQPASMLDTVGAGDAFAAATIEGLLGELPYQQVLNRAVTFAARICGIRGATTTEASVYHSLDEEPNN